MELVTKGKLLKPVVCTTTNIPLQETQCNAFRLRTSLLRHRYNSDAGVAYTCETQICKTGQKYLKITTFIMGVFNLKDWYLLRWAKNMALASCKHCLCVWRARIRRYGFLDLVLWLLCPRCLLFKVPQKQRLNDSYIACVSHTQGHHCGHKQAFTFETMTTHINTEKKDMSCPPT